MKNKSTKKKTGPPEGVDYKKLGKSVDKARKDNPAFIENEERLRRKEAMDKRFRR